jgi:hypothetical protein
MGQFAIWAHSALERSWLVVDDSVAAKVGLLTVHVTSMARLCAETRDKRLGKDYLGMVK